MAAGIMRSSRATSCSGVRDFPWVVDRRARVRRFFSQDIGELLQQGVIGVEEGFAEVISQALVLDLLRVAASTEQAKQFFPTVAKKEMPRPCRQGTRRALLFPSGPAGLR